MPSSTPSSDKENLHKTISAASKTGRSGQVVNYGDTHQNHSRNAAFASQDARISKAQSSVASSTHYAQGFLPQYPRAGQRSSDYYVRYHQNHPYGGTYSGSSGVPRAGHGPYSPQHYPPQYDGPTDSSPPRTTKVRSDDKVNGSVGSANGPNEDDGKVDIKDFQTDRGDLPSGHNYAVDRFFQNLREAERKEIESSEQKASKKTI